MCSMRSAERPQHLHLPLSSPLPLLHAHNHQGHISQCSRLFLLPQTICEVVAMSVLSNHILGKLFFLFKFLTARPQLINQRSTTTSLC